jgi:Tail-tube assembly protein
MAQKNVQLPDTINLFGINIPTGFTNYFKVDTNTGSIIPTYQGGQPIPGAKVTDLNSINKIRAAAGLGPIDASGKSTGPAPTTSSPTTNEPTSTKTSDGLTLNLNKVLNGQTLKYPNDLNEGESGKQTYLKFKSYDFSTVQKSNDIYSIGNSSVGNLLGDVVTTVSGSIGKTPYKSDEIKLYVPPNINVNYGANWGEAALGAIPTSSNPNDQDILGAISNLFRGFGSSFSQTTLDEVVKKLSNVPEFSATGSDILGVTTGLVFNKNEFSTFNNMQLRTFSYSFLFVARSESEKKSINRIINTFKIAMHPSGTTIGSSGIASANNGNTIGFTAVARPPVLKYPKLWTIEYFIGKESNKFIPKTKFCAITNVSVNYTPNSVFTTLTDGQVPAIQMDISFKELTPLIADQIIDGGLLDGKETKIFTDTGVDSDYNPNNGGTF